MDKVLGFGPSDGGSSPSRGIIKMKKIKNKNFLKSNQISFSLNPKIYPLEAIEKTANMFSDRAFVLINGQPKKEIMVCLEGKKKLKRKDLENLKKNFLNELLNSVLRRQIFKEKKKILESIIAGAITAALNPPQEKKENEKDKEMDEIEKEIKEIQKELEKELKEGYKKDPLKIAKPYHNYK